MSISLENNTLVPPVQDVPARIETAAPSFRNRLVSWIKATFDGEFAGLEKFSKLALAIAKTGRAICDTIALRHPKTLENRHFQEYNRVNNTLAVSIANFVDVNDLFGVVSGVGKLIAFVKKAIDHTLKPTLKNVADGFIGVVQLGLNPLNILSVKWKLVDLGVLSKTQWGFAFFKCPIPIITLAKDTFVSVHASLEIAQNAQELNKLKTRLKCMPTRLAMVEVKKKAYTLLEEKKRIETSMIELDTQRGYVVMDEERRANLSHLEGINQELATLKSTYQVEKGKLAAIKQLRVDDAVLVQRAEAKWEKIAALDYVPKGLQGREEKIKDRSQIVGTYLDLTQKRIQQLPSQIERDMMRVNFKIATNALKIGIISLGIIAALTMTSLIAFFGAVVVPVVALSLCAVGFGVAYTAYQEYLLKQKKLDLLPVSLEAVNSHLAIRNS